MGHCFNSRAHGGRDRSPATRGSAATRFNSRAHGGRDCSSFLLGAPRLVSIHAPTGGATTCEHTARGPHAGSFNSRAHGGRDPLVTYPYDGSTVSIHAPTGGATPSRCRRPTRRRFQFTRPRGARLSPWRKTRRGAGFNSRAHGGRDTFCRFIFYNLILFQFTRPRGARLRLSCVPRGSNPFQFTRPRGARQAVDEPVERLDEFQFTRPRGARPLVFSFLLVDDRFNSRAHGGRDW